MYMWLRRVVEYAWLFVIAICIYEIIINVFNGNLVKAGIFGAIGIFAFILFRVRRSQRKRIEKEAEQ
jgi:Flp pilus assembly protein TadB